MKIGIRNLRFASAALVAAGALALAIPASAQTTNNNNSSTTGEVESGAKNAASDVGSAASNAASDVGSAASKAASKVTGNTNADILSELHESNQAEVEMGKLALEKGTSSDVKSYGKMLIHDHSAADRKVREVASNLGVRFEPPAPESRSVKKERNEDASNREALEGKSGTEFDTSFLQAMKADHEQDIQEASRAQNSTSNQQVKSLIAEMMPKLKEHRDRAENLLARNESTSSHAGAAAGAGARTSGASY